MRTLTTILSLAAFGLIACDGAVDAPATDPASADSWSEAVAEGIVRDATDATSEDLMLYAFVDLSDATTIGEHVEESLDSIADFWASQGDCNDVSLDSGMILVDFGSLDDPCTYAGNTYAGLDWIDIAVNGDDLEMYHTFEAFTDGSRVLDGGVDVRWVGDSTERDLKTNYTVANLDASLIWDVESDHRVRRLDPDLTMGEYGFMLDGERTRTIDGDTYTITLDNLEMKVDNAAPSGGSMTWTGPDGEITEIRFDELDSAIRAELTRSGESSYYFIVQPNGEITSEEVN